MQRVGGSGSARWSALVVALTLPLATCTKVRLYPVGAAFVVADATWFEEEQTLFFFTDVSAEQGLGDESVVEVTWVTDDGEVDWIPLSDVTNVHTHVPVDCGPDALCGSASVHVPELPRQVNIRLRYHRDGDLALLARPRLNIVHDGPMPDSRSLVVYGVFDRKNERVQWRGRHNFPTLRNEEVERLGLRRQIDIDAQHHGTPDEPLPFTNPYGYGEPCPDDYTPLDQTPLSFDERAAFNEELLPVDAYPSSEVCARATVYDAVGPFSAPALARKNPEVRPAFPALRSPVEDAVILPFFLGPCDRVISEDHEAMLRQRLLLGDIPITCTEGWDQEGFVDRLASTFRDAIEATRPDGRDMVLAVALNQDERGVTDVVEQALDEVVPQERLRNTPRVAGAFVLDSELHTVTTPELSQSAVWCPASLNVVDASIACAVAPDNPELELGPFSFSALPILPPRGQYLDFIATYSVNAAGRVTGLAYRVPEFSVTATHVDLGEFGAATFLDDEVITAEREDAFSICVDAEPNLYLFRPSILEPGVVSPDDCAALGLPEEVCALIEYGALPLDYLPDWHNFVADGVYDLGVWWEFPYLARLDYETSFAGAVSAFGLSVPFGVRQPGQAYYGTPLWLEEEFSLEGLLTQCDRFCDHPTFDSAGIYQVLDDFRSAYAHACYAPQLPELGDGGFPRDP